MVDLAGTFRFDWSNQLDSGKVPAGLICPNRENLRAALMILLARRRANEQNEEDKQCTYVQ